ncbi:MAG: hypothetical protein UT87_C0001G0033 [Candidatus Levybacteria bacterium GW2011_GWC1_40_19]|nr:MAG: hypothetical protein UT46_C0010G0007 [Candidatus Levybacteria bacterium GW2011_GWA1_39_34]KKR51703.1 MAG: hypothetical protein UT87_C0001G0033 [Candidatus Levybacteria bacterium GW2011_GWC1_40_19]KKR94517.1 MAG: hypothetical protein UU45_C0009G0026 [Candidatus Levybacteria bacterium GW2011_GWA2_41_15]KKS01417.1 MAG: hypothetical protein UU52_C0012G0007 [Candidatus Levybacteria bacterium GW2011_GWB1_41_21]OGH20624.1 MAG: threonylcarbamoyl-AMP synthase [Candidatus Levybacteria bacterium R
MTSDLKKAIDVLKKGGIIIFPTDTAFGIGCRIDDEKAIERLFEIRKRPESKATPVLFSSIKQVEEYVLPFGLSVRELMEKHWPGGLTIVLPANLEKVPSLVRGGGLNIGVRIPDHVDTQALIKMVDAPILGPSANFHGDPTPYSYNDLNRDLISKVDYVLNGETKTRISSTVIDCSVNPWRVLRFGAVRDI